MPIIATEENEGTLRTQRALYFFHARALKPPAPDMETVASL